MKRLHTDSCGFATALTVIGGKWKTHILWEVTLAPCRFGALRRLLPGVSEKVLTQQLREMEGDGLITRREFGDKVRAVEYAVTELGRSLNGAVTAMSVWGKSHERWRATRASRSPTNQLSA